MEPALSIAQVEGSPGTSLEWVRVDDAAISPIAVGLYYLDFHDANGTPTDKVFFVDPLLTVLNETVRKITDTQYVIQKGTLVAGTLRLFRMPGNIQLNEGIDYNVDAAGKVRLVGFLLDNEEHLSADYRYSVPSTGPWEFHQKKVLTDPIPGVALALASQAVAGDRVTVVVG